MKTKIGFLLIIIWMFLMIVPAVYIYSHYDDCKQIGYEEAVILYDDGFEIYCQRAERVKLP